MRVRFAPSPTGSLHLGNARTALFNWLVARQTGGTFVLRIEDTDTERHQEHSERTILQDLRWLGLEWDEGPEAGGSHGPYRQSERSALYAQAVEKLMTRGRAYRCFCDPTRLEEARQRRLAEGHAPHYDGRCRSLSSEESASRAAAGAPFAIRFRTVPAGAVGEGGTVVFRDRLRGAVEFPLTEIGDTVIVRPDGRPTYNFAVVVDDAAMAIDLVVRGDDHLSNTPRQVLMFEALGQRPPEFAHLPMVRGADGSRLSKRHGAVSVGEYARNGYPVPGMLNTLVLLGWSPGGDRTILTREEMVREFDLDRIVRSPATFDPQKLEWICAQHVQHMSEEAWLSPLRTALGRPGLLPETWTPEIERWSVGLIPILRNYVSHFAQIPERCAPIFFAGGAPAEKAARDALADPAAIEVVTALEQETARQPPRDLEAWKQVKQRVKEVSGQKGRALFHPLRIAITGFVSGPELDALIPLIEQGHVILPEKIVDTATRVRRTLEWLRGD